MAKILYLGDNHPAATSSHRAKALERLGHSVDIQDVHKVVASQLDSPLLHAIHYRTGFRLLQGKITKWLTGLLEKNSAYDVVWVDSGELLSPASLNVLKSLGCPVVLYNLDDPTGKRDGRRFDVLLKALPLYDLVAVVRKESEEECRQLHAKRVLRVLRSYDEVAHKPFDSIDDIPASFRSEVVFIGTWMRHEKRDDFMMELLRQGVPLSIWGSRWSKSPHWETLKASYRGGNLSGRDYVAAIQGSKICLGLLSKGNRDLHTQRSLEVPYAGGLFCAERTTEHQEIYEEGKEAVFWADAAECATICKKLLSDDALRESIRLAGMRKIRAIGVGNEDICRKILAEVNIH
ncbi:glycosyltransferase [Hymenobacter sp. GOD-10R]|uniref:CgeB family protein n=1 Tax=Hymenobacter sp. GOD-10R TaxID=3093922 RepID=UPI002D795F92|nr:glycosyltransferase [Hymenobacter sp. GOD-10R]WRQ28051.1 glycosyltransferase [Hymenobacter sp. GOD-10R]